MWSGSTGRGRLPAERDNFNLEPCSLHLHQQSTSQNKLDDSVHSDIKVAKPVTTLRMVVFVPHARVFSTDWMNVHLRRLKATGI